VLNRQRVILALLDRAGGSIQRTMLVKLAFLLREETAVGQDRTYYWFVPYRQGPFSFALYRDLASLERDGYVELAQKAISLRHATRDLSRKQFGRLPLNQNGAVESVVEQYGQMKRSTLLQNVYRKYPWYAINSELEEFIPSELPRPSRRPIAVYTVGYEGKSVDEFFNRLLSAGMTAILDVRANPISRKYGFAKGSISQIAHNLGIGYQHLPELGISSARRADLSDFESYQRLLDDYQSRMLPERAADVHKVADLVRSQVSALLCMEKDVRCCHRGRLAHRVAEESGLAVVHL